MNATYAAAAEAIRTQGAELLGEAFDLAASAPEGEYKFRNSTGKIVRYTQGDGRHPANRAKAMRREARILMAWAAEDEAAYTRYISDGLGATDGYYAPKSRPAWKATLGA